MTTHAASASISLMKIVNWDGTSQDINQALTAAFDAKDYRDCIKNLHSQGIEPLSYIDSLDKVSYTRPSKAARLVYNVLVTQIIDTLPTDSVQRKRCIQALRTTCGIYGILPTSHIAPFTLSKPGIRPFATGNSSSVWKVTDENHPDQVFAVRSFHLYAKDAATRIYKVAHSDF